MPTTDAASPKKKRNAYSASGLMESSGSRLFGYRRYFTAGAEPRRTAGKNRKRSLRSNRRANSSGDSHGVDRPSTRQTDSRAERVVARSRSRGDSVFRRSYPRGIAGILE